MFKYFIIFTSIIIIHEFGHLIIALLFKWKVEKLIILPFGGITIFNEKIDKPLYQEFLIAIAGPLFQIIFYYLYKDNYIFSYLNKTILLFNLLPIYPLDGSKIINIISNMFISFKYSHIFTIFISITTTILILLSIYLYNLNLLLILILLFIIKEIFNEIKKHNFYFNKFLLERYLYKNKYKKTKIISNIKKMKKQTTHIFSLNNKYYNESYILSKRFDK